jgi:hypothetical protein
LNPPLVTVQLIFSPDYLHSKESLYQLLSVTALILPIS